jgi:hypothetical protein
VFCKEKEERKYQNLVGHGKDQGGYYKTYFGVVYNKFLPGNNLQLRLTFGTDLGNLMMLHFYSTNLAHKY